MFLLLLSLLAVRRWPISQPPRAEAFKQLSHCSTRHHTTVRACVLWAVVVQFILVRPATLSLPSTTLAIPSQPTHTGRESVDQWSRVPTGTVVEQIASIAAVTNVISDRCLQRILTPNLNLYTLVVNVYIVVHINCVHGMRTQNCVETHGASTSKRGCWRCLRFEFDNFGANFCCTVYVKYLWTFYLHYWCCK